MSMRKPAVMMVTLIVLGIMISGAQIAAQEKRDDGSQTVHSLSDNKPLYKPFSEHTPFERQVTDIDIDLSSKEKQYLKRYVDNYQDVKTFITRFMKDEEYLKRFNDTEKYEYLLHYLENSLYSHLKYRFESSQEGRFPLRGDLQDKFLHMYLQSDLEGDLEEDIKRLNIRKTADDTHNDKALCDLNKKLKHFIEQKRGVCPSLET